MCNLTYCFVNNTSSLLSTAGLTIVLTFISTKICFPHNSVVLVITGSFFSREAWQINGCEEIVLWSNQFSFQPQPVCMRLLPRCAPRLNVLCYLLCLPGLVNGVWASLSLSQHKWTRRLQCDGSSLQSSPNACASHSTLSFPLIIIFLSTILSPLSIFISIIPYSHITSPSFFPLSLSLLPLPLSPCFLRHSALLPFTVPPLFPLSFPLSHYPASLPSLNLFLFRSIFYSFPRIRQLAILFLTARRPCWRG